MRYLIHSPTTRIMNAFASLSTGIEVFGIDLLFIGLPIVCLLGIVFFVLYRR